MSDNVVPYSISATLGALLVGGFSCTLLSGIVSMQAYLYARVYRNDRMRLKSLVLFVWLLDILHTVMVSISNWLYLIDSFGNQGVHDTIFWSVGASVAITAVVTFCAHCFYVHRLYRLSRGNLWLTIPIAVIALFRVVSACITTSEMIRLGEYSLFLERFRWVFTLGLVLSTVVDVMIAIGLCYFLEAQRSGSSDMDLIIDSVILYTVENGGLTCMATMAALACWLAMPHNLIFMGLHFAISKLYANSLLASLNARNSLRRVQVDLLEAGGQRPAAPNAFLGNPIALSQFSRCTDRDGTTTQLEINVQKTVDFVVEDCDPYSLNISRDDYSNSRKVGDTNLHTALF